MHHNIPVSVVCRIYSFSKSQDEHLKSPVQMRLMKRQAPQTERDTFNLRNEAVFYL